MANNVENLPLSEGWNAVIYREWNFPSEVITAWDSMACDSGDTGIFISHGWFENWWRAFGKEGELLVIVILKDSDIKGIFPCCLKAGSLHGPNRATICSLTNDHTYHYDFLVNVEDSRDTLLNFIRLIHLKHPKKQMYFDCTTSSPNIRSLVMLLHDSHIPFHQYMQPWAPWMRIENDVKLLFAKIPGRLKNSIRRYRKKADKQGAVSFQVYERDAHLDEVLNAMFDVEYKSWKGRSGTAIKCDAEVESFYRGYARLAMKREQLLIPVLTVNDIPVAADYCLRSGGTVFLLKAGYNESFSRISPGNLLHAEMFAYLANNDRCLFYNFLGACESWKMEWTQMTHHYGFVRVYPKTAKGWSQYMVTYGWKNFLKKVNVIRKRNKLIDQIREKVAC